MILMVSQRWGKYYEYAGLILTHQISWKTDLTMLHQPGKTTRFTYFITILQMILSLAACLLCATQAFLLVYQQGAFCLNQEGCDLVEGLTKVSPVIVNLLGSLYFLILFLALWGSKKSVVWANSVLLILLAGVAAEGVLISYQEFIVGVYCSYCLMVFGCVVVLNLLAGWRQILMGIFVFGSIVVVFSGLKFISPTESDGIDLNNGIYGSLEIPGAAEDLYLFFSASCPHCEDVIASIDEDFSCSLNFNPVQQIQTPPLKGITVNDTFSPETNLRFLKQLNIWEVPVLAIQKQNEIRVIRGKKSIVQFLDQNCRPQEFEGSSYDTDVNDMSLPAQQFPYFDNNEQKDACVVEESCVEVVPVLPPEQQ